MQKRWIHPLFKPSKRRSVELSLFSSSANLIAGETNPSEVKGCIAYNSAPRSGRFGSISDPAAPNFIHRNRVSLFLATTVLAIFISVTAVATKAKFTRNPDIIGLELSDFRIDNYAPIDKGVFLSRLSLQSKRQMAAQIHYVTELIKTSKLPREEAKKLAFTIVAESMRSGYDPLFVTSIIKSESTFNKHAVSYAGAMGLMQIMPDTGKFVSRLKNVEWKGSHKLTDPAYNIRLGIAYLKHLEKAFDGNRELMLIAYNWGPKNVIDSLKNQKRVPRSCIRYAKTIINNHGRWNADYSQNMAQFQYLDIDYLS